MPGEAGAQCARIEAYRAVERRIRPHASVPLRRGERRGGGGRSGRARDARRGGGRIRLVIQGEERRGISHLALLRRMRERAGGAGAYSDGQRDGRAERLGKSALDHLPVARLQQLLLITGAHIQRRRAAGDLRQVGAAEPGVDLGASEIAPEPVERGPPHMRLIHCLVS